MNKIKNSSYQTLKAAKKFSRRTALKRGAAVAALVGTGPIFVKNAFAASSGSVSVYAWMDYIQPNIVEAFEKASGIKVNLATFGSNDEAEQKTKASQGKGFDVIFPSVTNRGNYEDPSAPNGIWLGKIDAKKAEPALNAIIPSFLWDSIELGATFRGDR
jgi:spermidine/putrescine transport system substrate-binding protein